MKTSLVLHLLLTVKREVLQLNEVLVLHDKRTIFLFSKFPVQLLQHEDFFDDPTVAAASVLQGCLAADELRGSLPDFVLEDFRRLDFLTKSILPLGQFCSCNLVGATDFSVRNRTNLKLVQSLRELQSLNTTNMIWNMLQNHLVPTRQCATCTPQVALVPSGRRFVHKIVMIQRMKLLLSSAILMIFLLSLNNGFLEKVYRELWLSELSPEVSFGFLTTYDLQRIEDSRGAFNFLRAHFRVFELHVIRVNVINVLCRRALSSRFPCVGTF